MNKNNAYGDNGVLDGLTDEGFGGLLHFDQHHRAHFLREESLKKNE
jgi:hypothetical protein